MTYINDQAELDQGMQAGLAQAQQMTADGCDQEDVWEQTHWFQGPDDMFRTEISDDGMVVHEEALGDGPVALPDVVEHPDLYSAFPELADFQIQGGDDGGVDGAMGWYANGLINIEDPGDQETLRHELQHAVQDVEGAPPGSYGANPDTVGWDAYAADFGEIEAGDAEQGGSAGGTPELLGLEPHG